MADTRLDAEKFHKVVLLVTTKQKLKLAGEILAPADTQIMPLGRNDDASCEA